MTVNKTQIIVGILFAMVLGLFAWNIQQTVYLNDLFYWQLNDKEQVELNTEIIDEIVDYLVE